MSKPKIVLRDKTGDLKILEGVVEFRDAQDKLIMIAFMRGDELHTYHQGEVEFRNYLNRFSLQASTFKKETT